MDSSSAAYSFPSISEAESIACRQTAFSYVLSRVFIVPADLAGKVPLFIRHIGRFTQSGSKAGPHCPITTPAHVWCTVHPAERGDDAPFSLSHFHLEVMYIAGRQVITN